MFVFGQVEFKFLFMFFVIVGLCYLMDYKIVDYVLFLIDLLYVDVVLQIDEFLVLGNFGVNCINYGDFVVCFLFNWKLLFDMLLFVLYNCGIKGGNWMFSLVIMLSNFCYDFEMLYSFEVGFKYLMLDYKFCVNGIFYYYIYEDYQVFGIVGGLLQVSNSDVCVIGVELEVIWQLVDWLSVMFGGIWEILKVDWVLGVGLQIVFELFLGVFDV